jgi:hypothetical protein
MTFPHMLLRPVCSSCVDRLSGTGTATGLPPTTPPAHEVILQNGHSTQGSANAEGGSLHRACPPSWVAAKAVGLRRLLHLRRQRARGSPDGLGLPVRRLVAKWSPMGLHDNHARTSEVPRRATPLGQPVGMRKRVCLERFSCSPAFSHAA